MSDLWQCYLIGLGSGILLTSIPCVILRRRLRREQNRSYWARWWLRHQQQMRSERKDYCDPPEISIRQAVQQQAMEAITRRTEKFHVGIVPAEKHKQLTIIQ